MLRGKNKKRSKQMLASLFWQRVKDSNCQIFGYFMLKILCFLNVVSILVSILVKIGESAFVAGVIFGGDVSVDLAHGLDVGPAADIHGDLLG